MGKSTFLYGPIGLILSLGACQVNEAYGVQILSPLESPGISTSLKETQFVNQALKPARTNPNSPPQTLPPIPQSASLSLEPLTDLERSFPGFSQKTASNLAPESTQSVKPKTDLTPTASLTPQQSSLLTPQALAYSSAPLPETEPAPPSFSQKRIGRTPQAATQSANQWVELAQTVSPPEPTQESLPPSLEPIPEIEPALPPPSDLLQPPAESPTLPILPVDSGNGGLCVRQFIVTGSTVFSSEELSQAAQAAVFSPDTPRCTLPTEGVEGYELTFPQLLQARSAVTEFYLDQKYVTSGAFIPEQTLQGGIVEIQIVEGRLEDIQVTGNQRLNPNYVRNRLEIAGSPPLNIDRLLEGLQLLQLDPLIETIDAELSAGITPGSNLLEVKIVEADAFQTQVTLDNGRSPNVGSFRQEVELSHANLLGQGDDFSIGFANTNGSETLNLGYIWPINPRNGTVSFNFGVSWSRVIEDSFEILNIESNSRFFELTVRQPIYQTPTEEFALSFAASRQASEAVFDPFETGEAPFPSRGSDADGETRISALRFAQDWVRRSDRQVIAARSQFSLGLDLLNSTVNENAPDSRFFAWRGQAQWVRLLAPDTLFLLRGDVQMADSPLASLEQISLGGQRTVRGYPQDELLTDNGALMSAEFRVPIYRNSNINGLLQINPFVDIGVGWNASGERLDPNTLVGIGLGLQWRQGDKFSARLDWGLPLTSVDPLGESLQENGLYFSVTYTPF